MKSIKPLLFILAVAIVTSCSKSDNSDFSPLPGSSPDAALPGEQVNEIVNAVSAGDVTKVTLLLQSNPKLVGAKFVSGGPYSGWPLVMIAARQGNKPLVELLVLSGADVNEKNLSGEVALHYAASQGHKEIVQFLLDQKAEVNVKNDADATPLSVALSAGKADVAALLRQHGAKD